MPTFVYNNNQGRMRIREKSRRRKDGNRKGALVRGRTQRTTLQCSDDGVKEEIITTSTQSYFLPAGGGVVISN